MVRHGGGGSLSQRRRVPRGVLGAAACLLAAGCFNPQTRTPEIYNGSPSTERQAFSKHDPLPDTTLGPDTGMRPRGTEVMRNEPRRVRETTDRPNPYIRPVPPGAMLPEARHYPEALRP